MFKMVDILGYNEKDFPFPLDQRYAGMRGMLTQQNGEWVALLPMDQQVPLRDVWFEVLNDDLTPNLDETYKLSTEVFTPIKTSEAAMDEAMKLFRYAVLYDQDNVNLTYAFFSETSDRLVMLMCPKEAFMHQDFEKVIQGILNEKRCRDYYVWGTVGSTDPSDDSRSVMFLHNSVNNGRNFDMKTYRAKDGELVEVPLGDNKEPHKSVFEWEL